MHTLFFSFCFTPLRAEKPLKHMHLCGTFDAKPEHFDTCEKVQMFLFLPPPVSYTFKIGTLRHTLRMQAEA